MNGLLLFVILLVVAVAAFALGAHMQRRLVQGDNKLKGWRIVGGPSGLHVTPWHGARYADLWPDRYSAEEALHGR